jgi:hypothetical protein
MLYIIKIYNKPLFYAVIYILTFSRQIYTAVINKKNLLIDNTFSFTNVKIDFVLYLQKQKSWYTLVFSNTI